MTEATSEAPVVTEGLESKLRNLCVNAARLLPSSNDLPLSQVEPTSAMTNELTFYGMMQFTGRCGRGVLGLAVNLKLLRSTNPLETSHRDWTAELTNQLFGRIKNQLLRLGMEIYPAGPVVASSQHVRLDVHNPLAIPTFLANEEGGFACVWVEFEGARSFQGRQMSESEVAEVPNEGDVILF